MIQVQKNPLVNNDFMRLAVYNLQPSSTSRNNFHLLSDSRLKTTDLRDDLTFQEISDVKEYHSSSEKPMMFGNVKDLLQDLHE